MIVIVRQCLHSLNQEQFLIQTQWQRWIQQVAGIPRLPPKLLWSESADLKFSASTEEKRGQQESAEQRDHRLAQRRQHRQQEREEQGTSIESGSITFSSQKPFTCVKKKMIYVAANLVSSIGVLPMYGPWVRIPLKSRNCFRVTLHLLKLQLPLQRSFVFPQFTSPFQEYIL